MAFEFLHYFNFSTNFINIIATETSIVYCWVFGQWCNIPHQRIAYWSVANMEYWSVSKWKQVKYWVIGKVSNNKLYWFQLQQVPFSLDILLMRSEEIVWHLGQHSHLNTTRTDDTILGNYINKKVLLRECKRHTAGCVVSTPSVVLTGYPPSRVPPILTWPGGYPARGYPI